MQVQLYLIYGRGLIRIQSSSDKEAVGCNTLVYVVHNPTRQHNLKFYRLFSWHLTNDNVRYCDEHQYYTTVPYVFPYCKK